MRVRTGQDKIEELRSKLLQTGYLTPEDKPEVSEEYVEAAEQAALVDFPDFYWLFVHNFGRLHYYWRFYGMHFPYFLRHKGDYFHDLLGYPNLCENLWGPLPANTCHIFAADGEGDGCYWFKCNPYGRTAMYDRDPLMKPEFDLAVDPEVWEYTAGQKESVLVAPSVSSFLLKPLNERLGITPR